MIKAVPRCLDCVFNQAYRITEILNMDEEKAWNFLKNSMIALGNVPDKTSPLHMTRVMYDVLESFGYTDPFRDHKSYSIELARKFLSEMKNRVKNAEDPLFEALHVSAAGNAIDFGQRDTSPEKVRERLISVLEKTFHAPAYEEFRKDLEKGKTVLFIGDNTGESVIDTILMCLLKDKGYEILYAVRHVPIINDVTYQDAVASGIQECAKIIDSGSVYPGVILDESSEEFQEAFDKASVVISKGQGNLEGLYGVSKKVFFLLTPKCPHIAEIAGVPELTPVFYRAL